MRIAMIGAGYVGVTTATCLAELGHDLSCFDIDEARIGRLSTCDLPFYEPGLSDMLRRAIAARKIGFTSSAADCVRKAEAVFIAVGTPSGPDGDIDLSQVEAAARLIAPHLRSGALVIVKSTVTAGTCRRVREVIADVRRALDIGVASNPEFLREGSAVNDFMKPDRIVIGVDDARSGNMLREMYRQVADQGVPVLSTTPANAELIKHAANALLAVKIGFINDVSDLCEKVGGDVLEVAEGIGLDRRIGRSFLVPGPGYGGSCFPKDTRAFAATGRRYDARQSIVETLIERNEERKTQLANRILSRAKLKKGNAVGVLGLAFKANTDDVRESAAITIINILQRRGITVRAHDPRARENAARLLEGVGFHDTAYEAARGADALVVLTEWDEYRALDATRIASEMKGRIVFDYRNVFPSQAASQCGLTCIRLGGRAGKPRKDGAGASAVSWLDRRVASSGKL